MKIIRVIVHGALGKMGQEVLRALEHEEGLKAVGAVDINAQVISLALPSGNNVIPCYKDLPAAITALSPDVIVDFSIASAALPAARTAISNGVYFVSGTTGLSDKQITEIDALAREKEVGALIASNFALGAVLMMHFASIAAKYLDYAEIIESHHEKKIDAPSGTSISTAKAMMAARGKPFNNPYDKNQPSRGQLVEGTVIHSTRLPGVVARQEVIFGGEGQTLSVKHDSINRQSFMPGVMLAVKLVGNYKRAVLGLEKLLEL